VKKDGYTKPGGER
jgi:hypothetical protein